MTMNEVHQDRALSTDVDWLGAKLAPLREGKPVALSLILAKKPSKVKRVAEQRDKVITLVPGKLFGFSERTVVISVVDNGSCIIEIDCNSTARMVLAGIPAKLAKALLVKLRSTLGESNHGNSTTSRRNRKKRPSSGATGWKGRAPSVTIVPRSAYRYTGKE